MVNRLDPDLPRTRWPHLIPSPLVLFQSRVALRDRCKRLLWPWHARKKSDRCSLFIYRHSLLPRRKNLHFSMPAPSFRHHHLPAGESFQRCEQEWQQRPLKWQDQTVCRVTCQPPLGPSSPDLLFGPCMQLLLPHALCALNLTLTIRLKYSLAHMETDTLYSLGKSSFSFFCAICYDNRHKLKKPSPFLLLLTERRNFTHTIWRAQRLRMKAVKKKKKDDKGTVRREAHH